MQTSDYEDGNTRPGDFSLLRIIYPFFFNLQSDLPDFLIYRQQYDGLWDSKVTRNKTRPSESSAELDFDWLTQALNDAED